MRIAGSVVDCSLMTTCFDLSLRGNRQRQAWDYLGLTAPAQFAPGDKQLATADATLLFGAVGNRGRLGRSIGGRFVP